MRLLKLLCRMLVLLLLAVIGGALVGQVLRAQPTPVLPGIVSVTIPGRHFTSIAGYDCILADAKLDCTMPTPAPTVQSTP